MNIITPITSNPGLAFLPTYRWDKQLTRARRRARVELVRITRDIGQRYAQEQAVEAQSEAINRHWRSA